MTAETATRTMAETESEGSPEQRLEAVERENRELRALLEANLGVQGELSLDLVLQRVVDQAAQLLGARYGALSVTDSEGRIEQFVTTGIEGHEKEMIGAPPKGVGLLGVPLREGQVLRLDDLGSHPRSAGFPDEHPPMRSLLAVPIICRSPHRGNLYLAEKNTRRFTEEDEGTLERFARGAAAVIDTAHLHLRSESLAIAEERLRISREIHDGVAQVLAYVNTKAQAAREFLDRDRYDEAGGQLDELAAAAREVYSEVREGILALRLQPTPTRPLTEALRDYVEHWQRRGATVVDLQIEPGLKLSSEIQLQVVRIVQEALTNVRKHAQAQHVEILFERGDGSLELAVIDDGRGFSPPTPGDGERPGRFGLSVMKERAEALGGRFELDTAPGRGTSIRVSLPLHTVTPPTAGGTEP